RIHRPGETLCTVADIRQWLKDRNLSAGGNKSELIDRAIRHDPQVKILSVLEAKQKDGRKKVIKPEVFDQAKAMAASVRQHPDAQQLLSEGEPEVSVWGQHDDTGLLTKCRPDWLRDGICVDLKTCGCASPRTFGRQVCDFGYDLQQAHYLNTLNSAGIPVEVFAFIAVESEPPYLTQVYILDNEHAAMAVRRWHQVMCDLYECQQQDRWPGYTDEVELPLPGWYARQYGDLA
ncbi:PD-(D/E)XK nuclease-like domain-containing protein, partial [Endozoicomonas sp. SESOKO1]|uniref:PD-(D/E)XK nuclease-like domain-containing protein n=1 Tax=Endozoicomonas sp. SESOKO1 TaxID=2828742 RepID=UPI0021473028